MLFNTFLPGCRPVHCFLISLSFFSLESFAQPNTWSEQPQVGLEVAPRSDAVAFSIGNKGYIGTGDDVSGVKKDFWEYDPSSNTWIQKADCEGNGRWLAVGFSIENKGYIGTGADSIFGYKRDFWEYDPLTNTWKRKADFG